MTEVLVATGTSKDDLHQVGNIADLPPGTPFTIHFQLQWWAPIGGLFDLPEMCTAVWIKELMKDKGDCRITDVEGGWHWVKIHCVANGTPVLLILAIIADILIGLGLLIMIARIDMTAVMQTAAKGMNIALIAGVVVLGVVGVAYILTKDKKKEVGQNVTG